MTLDPDFDAPEEVRWQGRFVRAVTRGKWEYAGRVGGVRAVVILAEHESRYILVEQHRAPLGGRCLELPAGLVGDHDPSATIEDTAVRELEEEAGFTAARIERLGDFHASPGMLSESFTLVRAHDVRKVGAGGGVQGEEEIEVHLVPRAEIAGFVAAKRAEGVAMDVKLLLLLAPGWLDKSS
ncbi:MAG: ADP-ribose pyrophosphatase [uncultured Sphingomonas sp.]|uniref:GDP-mannose pyrophosphatase n=1 Tax=uncultured Sphingomonas sp. TaxID=158754 RepID=A0A6J4SZN7_9SPHN|nr:NUDIX hydrolase [uncultured Sphingomonas sp.]CAA9509306.1 MAG: ADP-ribose pyrophosphatase [uncultured Sphingomonas sp.]